MVHKSSIIPGLSQFLDKYVLAHYPPTSLKRIAAAAGIALYLKQNSNLVDNIINNPMFAGLGIAKDNGMVDLDTLRDVFKSEIAKVNYMRIHFPILGDVDFTADDIDGLYNILVAIEHSSASISSPIMNTNVIGGI